MREWRSPPAFWSGKFSIFALLLWPFSYLVIGIGRIRQKLSTPYRVSVPVICVGNVVVGGSGKTPIVIELAKLLQQQGYTPHILSRGYGVRIDEPILVTNHHQAKDVGDEPLLLAKTAPTWVYADRCKTADLAIQDGATILLMDDGFQNPSLYKDIQLLVVDTAQGFGNGYVLPSGPLREPIKDAVTRANAVLLYDEKSNFSWGKGKPVFQVEIISNQKSTSSHYIAFAGIGRPEKFFTSLKNNGFSLIKTISFPDHYAYKDEDIHQLIALAKQYQARLITTEKDSVKISSFLHEFLEVFPIYVKFTEPGNFSNWLLQQLRNCHLTK